MMPAADHVLGGDPSKVCDVLREQHIAVCGGSSEYIGIGPSPETDLNHGGCFDPSGAQGLSERRRIHLVEQQLQEIDAAAVSRRCNSMRASISSGYAARYRRAASI